MWQLTEIKIKNIISFREASLKISQGVATLLFGKNEDNASQPCNGSGKSSLIEAISFALTGEQLRKVKSVEEIIHDSEDDAYVYLELQNDYDESKLTIERTISRNAPQSIECHKYNALGKEIEIDKTLQPSVADYNKFILSEIGLSKDDIYNFFILCDNKYESFFDCSDRDKKDIINRFSNGVIVDESIAKLQADMTPLSHSLNQVGIKIANTLGGISAIQTELAQSDEKQANAMRDRNARIAAIEGKINQCRQGIDNAMTQKELAENRLEILRQLQLKMVEMEKADLSFSESYRRIKEISDTNGLGEISDYDLQLQMYKEEIAASQCEISDIEAIVETDTETLFACTNKHLSALKQYGTNLEILSKLNEDDMQTKSAITEEIEAIDAQLDAIESLLKSNKDSQTELERLIMKCSVLLNGAVTCPKCSYKFFVNTDKSVDEVIENMTKYRSEIDTEKARAKRLNGQFESLDKEAEGKSEQIRHIDHLIQQRNADLEQQYLQLKELGKSVDVAEKRVSDSQKQLRSAKEKFEMLSENVLTMRNRLFGEINTLLENRVANGENFVQQQVSAIEFYQGQMTQYQQSKRDLLSETETYFAKSLKKSLSKYKADLEIAQQESDTINAEYNALKEQEAHFTMFKSHIARKKIDALSLVINDFLKKIGSDIRLRLEGFTVTKAGKLRDKISVQVMRDGIDCGSFHKFSGGEKARLNLACILALHTLTNSNCEDGKGLDFIIIDELLDKSDEVGLATYCEALNKLKQTALLVTQGSVAEAYPYKLLVVKKQGVSFIYN